MTQPELKRGGPYLEAEEYWRFSLLPLREFQKLTPEQKQAFSMETLRRRYALRDAALKQEPVDSESGIQRRDPCNACDLTREWPHGYKS